MTFYLQQSWGPKTVSLSGGNMGKLKYGSLESGVVLEGSGFHCSLVLSGLSE